MELSKKRKTEENGVPYTIDAAVPPPSLSPLTLSPKMHAKSSNRSNRHGPRCGRFRGVHSIADSDPAQRKLFIRGIGWETTTEKLRSIFSGYGELDEAIVITDKNTCKSKGYGFVTFKHIDGAILALKDPSKKYFQEPIDRVLKA